MAQRLARWLTGGGLVAVCVLVPAAPAGADLVSPPGACVATAAWRGGPLTVVSTSADPDDVLTIPRKATVDWTGKVVGPAAGTERAIRGEVFIDLPPLLGGITLDHWDGRATTVEKAGSYDYDLPSIIPAGVIFTVVGEHDEAGRAACDGEADVKIEGGAFDSPFTLIVLALLVLVAALLALIGRRPDGGAGIGRLILGGFLGLLCGLFGALALILFSVIPLNSALVDILIVAGLLLGAAWGRWAPLGAGGRAGPPPIPA